MSSKRGLSQSAPLPAELLPVVSTGKHYYRYDVVFNGKRIVKASIDPTTDMARALQKQGIKKGAVKLYTNGQHRMTISIEKFAKLRVRDSDTKGLFVQKYYPNPWAKD